MSLVAFSEMTELNKRCSQKTLDGHHLMICEVPAPTCIAVSSDDDIHSTEAISLYFESTKHGGTVKIGIIGTPEKIALLKI